MDHLGPASWFDLAAAAAFCLKASRSSGGGMVHVGPGVEPVSGLASGPAKTKEIKIKKKYERIKI